MFFSSSKVSERRCFKGSPPLIEKRGRYVLESIEEKMGGTVPYMAYKNIDETFWTDPQVKSLSFKERYLLLYLITNPHTHYSGLYYLPKTFICEETGLKKMEVTKGLDALSEKGFSRYDSEFSIIWVKKMARYQVQGEKISDSQVKGIANHFKTLHKHPFIKDFLDFYKDFNIPYEGGIDTPPTPPSESVTVSGTGEVSGEEEVLKETTTLSERFETFYKAYPQKRSKGQAETTWNKIKPNEQLLAIILAKIEQAKTSKKWKEDKKKEYIPYPSTWLNAKGWLDEYTPEVSESDENFDLIIAREEERQEASRGKLPSG